MSAPTNLGVLGDIHDGAVTIRPGGMVIPSGSADPDLYRDLVGAALLDGLAVRRGHDVSLTADGMGLLAEMGGEL